ncbi:MAG TPA: hypothetical protein VNN21_03580 [Dehalococcoidia bacterium]|nr:hypothetical protein [Dehalococcoidia bacterium]
MSREDARFYGWLALVFGPLFLLGGWLAVFTEVGVFLILAGLVALVLAPLLLRSVKAALAALALAVLGLGWPYVRGL